MGEGSVMKKILFAIALLGLTLGLSYVFYSLYFTPKIYVGGTEYSPNSAGRVFVQVLDNAFTPVDNAICDLVIYTPNNTIFYNGSMQPLGENGFYYYDFITPETEGVYMLSVSCIYPNELHTFYVVNFTSSTSTQGYVDEMYFIDNEFLKVIAGDINFIANFSVANTTNGTGTLRLKTIYEKPTDSVLDLQVYNYCTNTWESSPIRVDYNHPYIAYKIGNLSCYKEDDILMARLYGTVDTAIDIDLFVLDIYIPSGQYMTNLRGGGEVHVAYMKAVELINPSIDIIS